MDGFPFKVIFLTIEKKIKNILIFLPKGPNYSQKVKDILKNIEERQKPSKEDREVLNNEFGKDWKRNLGIEELEGEKIAKEAEIAVVDMFSASRIDQMEKIRQGGDASASASASPNDDSLQKLLDLDVAETGIQVIEKVPVRRAKQLQIQFIYHPIYPDDKISIVKEKIYGFGLTSGPPLTFHTLKIEDNPIFQHNLIETNLEYGIYDVKDRNLTYESRILPLLSEENDKTTELPIDKKFIRKFFVDKSLSIGNLTKQVIGKDVHTIYVVELMEILIAKYKSIERIQAYILNDPIISQEFYNGFILKYFPAIKETRDQYHAILTNNYVSPETKETVQKKYQTVFQEVELISKESSKKTRLFTQKEPAILSAIVQINYESFFRKEPTINLRALFEFFELNDVVPFMKFREPYEIEDNIINKIYYKVEPYNSTNWAFANLIYGTIMFKIRTSDKEEDQHYSTLYLYEDGKIKLEVSWSELQKASIHKLDKIFEIINKHFIEVINGMETVFLINRPKLPLATWENSRIINLNLIHEINDPKIILNEEIYRETLPILTKIFESYAVLDFSKKINLERNIFLLYWKYLRSSYFNPKTIQGGINNMQEVSPETEGIALEPDILFSQEEEGIEVFLKGQNYPKVIVNGVKSLSQAEPIFSFIDKLVYIALNINEIIKKPASSPWQFLIDKYSVYKNLSKASEAGLRIVKGKRVKKVKILQQVDPRLFDYPTKGKNIEFYSRICQTNAQPDIKSPEEVKSLDPKRVLEFNNKTYPGQVVYYYCSHHKYKYPGFKLGKHPEGFCLPCCYKTWSLENPNSTAYKNYIKCTGKEEEVEPEPLKPTVNRYIIQWGKIVQENRFGFPSPDLFKLMNSYGKAKGCHISKDVNQLERGSSCYLIYGIVQDHNSFFRAVAISLYGGTKFDEMRKPETIQKIDGFLDRTIDYLKANPNIFDILENGIVKREFANINTYINFLKSRAPDKEVYAKDLVSRFNIEYLQKSKAGINIIIFTENESGEASFRCSNYSLYETKDFLIITKDTFKKTYNPVVLVETDMSPLPKITIQRLFTPEKNRDLLQRLIKLYEILCLKKIKSELSVQKLQEIPSLEILDIYSSSSERLSGDYALIRWNKSEFFFPIKIILVNYKLPFFNPFDERDRLPSLEFLEKFLRNELNMKIIHILILEKTPKIQIAILDNNLPVFTQGSSKSNSNNHNHNQYPTTSIKYDLREINQALKEGKFVSDIQVEEIRNYHYEEDKYNSFLLLLSRSLTQEKDIKRRKKIIEIIQANEPLDNIQKFLKIFRQTEWRTTEDYNKFHKFLLTAFRKGLKRAMRIFDALAFDFDTKKKMEMLGVIYSPDLTIPQKNQKIKELIQETLKGKVKYISNTKESRTKEYLERKKYILFQDPLVLEKDLEERFVDKVSQELVLNDIARDIIFNGFIDPILQSNVYEKKPTEIVERTIALSR